MKKNNNYTSIEEMIGIAYRDFGYALQSQDYFECIKKLGVLEFLDVPDIENHMGIVYMLGGEYGKAIKCFEQMKQSSPLFSEAMKSLATSYMYVGDYLKLDNLLKRECFKISEIDEMYHRLSCLAHMSLEYLEAHREQIVGIEPRMVCTLSARDQKLFYNVCQNFAVSLAAAGECIKECFQYQLRNGKVIDIEHTPDMELYVRHYEKWALILSYSRFVKGIVFDSDNSSLATCALCDKGWQEKIAIFSTEKYVKQIVQIIFNLGRPEMHPYVDEYTAVVNILDLLMRIRPKAVCQIIAHYYHVVSRAYQKNIGSAVQYLGYAYAEILAQGFDPYQLKERIEQIRKQTDEYCTNDTVTNIKLTRKMSRKGHDAYLNAIFTFEKMSEGATGANDYSALALQFFRVIEIEYSEKLLKPLVSVMDIDQFIVYAKSCVDEDKKEEWLGEVKYLKRIKSGEQESFEIGVLRNLLLKVIRKDTKKDSCALYLRKILGTILSQEGKNALNSKEMINIIGRNSVDKYRIPGAHTGYVPYSIACEARDYVTRHLPEVVTWFD